MLDKYRLESYLKNDLFEGIIGKMDYLNLYDADTIDKLNTVLISIHDPDREVHPESKIEGFKDDLQIQFWDVEDDIGKYVIISDEQGKVIRDFIQKNKTSKFLIHCAAGQSRSTGVGCAVECIVNFNGSRYDYRTGSSDVKRLERYNLNLAVFDAIK